MLLNLKNVFKWVNVGGNRVFLLKDIDFEVEQGEFISIMGPSGSGKSTLLNVIGMLDGFDEGEYHFLHESVHKMKEKQRAALYKQYIGFVFQQYHLIDELTVYENIETPLIYQDLKGSERKAMVADMLDRFNIVGKKRFISYTAFRRATATGRYSKSINCKTKIVIGRRTNRQPQLQTGRRNNGAI